MYEYLYKVYIRENRNNAFKKHRLVLYPSYFNALPVSFQKEVYFFCCSIKDMLRSQILGSFEFAKTNEVNLHGYCDESFSK